MLIQKFFASSRTRLAPCFYFSRTLSESAQRALWASKIVREIFDASPQSNSSPSLREHLTTLQLNIQNYNLDPSIRNSVMKMFTTGIYLNSTVFNQEMIQEATQFKNGLFIFNPNYLVTKQMFQHLKTQRQNLLIRGAYGTGKTVSVVLFIRLAEMINKFRYEAFYDQSLTKTNELEYLKKLGLIQFLPKLYYWTVDTQSKEDPPISQLVLSQAYELSSQHLNKLKNLPSYHLPLNLQAYYWSAGITINVVIDQINYIASNVRKWNNHFQNLEMTNKKIDDKIEEEMRKFQESKQLTVKNIYGDRVRMLHQEKSTILDERRNNSHQNYYNTSIHLMNRLHKFQQYGGYSIFNSSANIQQKLLRNQNNSNINLIQFELLRSSEEIFSNRKITFQQNLQKQWGKTDFLQFFWFQLYRTLQDLGVSQKKLSQLRLKFSKMAKQFTFKMHYRFLHIRQVILQVKNKVVISQETSFDQINNFIELCINNFETFCKEKTKMKLIQFLNKGDEREKQFKLRFISILYFYAVDLTSTDGNAQIKLSTLKQILGSELSAQQKFIYFDKQNKKLLPFMSMGEIDQYEELHQLLFKDTKEDSMKHVVFIYSPLELSKMLVHFAIPKTHHFQYFFTSSFQRLSQNKAYLGWVFESTYMEVSFSIKDGNDMLFFIEYSTQFIPFKKKQGNINTFEYNLAKIIQLGPMMPRKYFAAFPATFSKDTNQQDSESVDLLIGMYSEGKYIINSIDVTISNNVDVINEKKNKALALFQQVFQMSKANEKFEINHIIFCPKAVCKQSFRSSRINILFSPIQDFKILRSQASLHEKLGFQRVRLYLNSMKRGRLAGPS